MIISKSLTLFLDPRIKNELGSYIHFNKAFRDDGWAIVATRGLDGTVIQKRDNGFTIVHGEWVFLVPDHMILFAKSRLPTKKPD